MSEVSDQARVQVLLADYAVSDAANKLNVIGAGFQVMGIQQTGATAPFSVVVIVETPPDLYGVDFVMELGLWDDDAGELVRQVDPGSGEATAIRMGRSVRADAPQFPGRNIPNGTIWSRQQMVANFPTGLQMTQGHTYEWRVKLDGNHKPGWTASFYLPAPAPGVVIG